MANISKIKTPNGTTYNLKDSISGYTTNTGTVTSVAISNATNGGLTVSGSPVNDSGTITIGHSNVLSSAQTTQAVYPIKIDKNGHISAYGSAQTILSLGTGSSNAYRGDYGNIAYTHATDSSRLTTATSSGLYKVASTAQGHIASLTAVQKSDITGLGIPASDTNTTYALSGALSSHKFTSTLTAGGSGSGTSTSDLTLAAGTGITLTDDTSNRKITIACSVRNTDYRVHVVETNPSGSTDYYPTWHTATSGNNVTLCANDGIKYQTKQGTASASGTSVLSLGNNIASGTAGNKYGQLYLYGTTAYAVSLYAGSPTATRVLTLPDATGTVALTSQIPTSAASHATGISIANHGTGTVIGVQSTTTSVTGVSGSTTVRGVKTTTTTASKASGGNGSASTWTFEEKSIPNVTSAGTAASASYANGILTFTNGVIPTIGTAIKVQSKSGGGNGTAPTWSFTDVTVPIMADADTTVPKAASSATTVPIKNSSASTFVTGTTHTITDNGHTHTLS